MPLQAFLPFQDMVNVSPLLSNEQLTGYEPYLPERSNRNDRLLLQRADYASLMERPAPVRIARIWKWGLRMRAGGNSHGHPLSFTALRLPPVQWSAPTRGYRAVSLRPQKQGQNPGTAMYVPAVFVPA